MPGNVENQYKLQIDDFSASDETAKATPAAETTRPVVTSIPAESEDPLREESASFIEATRQPQPVAASTPIVVPQRTSQRDRKWTRRVEDLPRGERWKRRLPEVCR